MNILLVSATLLEIAPFLTRIREGRELPAEMSGFRAGGHRLDVLITGIGMIPAACTIGARLAVPSYDLAIQAGIAGSYREELAPGTVVRVTEEIIAGFGAEVSGGFRSVFQLGLVMPDQPPFRDGVLKNPGVTGLSGSPGFVADTLPGVRGITSDTIHGSRQSIAAIKAQGDPDIETMEGAAFFYACLAASLPFIEIRAISNRVGFRDKARWQVMPAIAALNKTLTDIFSV